MAASSTARKFAMGCSNKDCHPSFSRTLCGADDRARQAEKAAVSPQPFLRTPFLWVLLELFVFVLVAMAVGNSRIGVGAGVGLNVGHRSPALVVRACIGATAAVDVRSPPAQAYVGAAV